MFCIAVSRLGDISRAAKDLANTLRKIHDHLIELEKEPPGIEEKPKNKGVVFEFIPKD